MFAQCSSASTAGTEGPLLPGAPTIANADWIPPWPSPFALPTDPVPLETRRSLRSLRSLRSPLPFSPCPPAAALSAVSRKRAIAQARRRWSLPGPQGALMRFPRSAKALNTGEPHSAGGCPF